MQREADLKIMQMHDSQMAELRRQREELAPAPPAAPQMPAHMVPAPTPVPSTALDRLRNLTSTKTPRLTRESQPADEKTPA